MKIDVIIPVYRPGEELFSLLDRLKQQTLPVHRVILMNTEKKYFEELLRKTGKDLAGTMAMWRYTIFPRAILITAAPGMRPLFDILTRKSLCS